MEARGHAIFVSARQRSIIHYLLDKYNIQYWDRGTGRNSRFGKVFYMISADIRLVLRSMQFKPDLFLSFASPYAAHAAWIMRKPHIVLDDTEHTRFAPFLYKPFSDVILNPLCFQKNMGSKQVRFNSYTELLYLHPKYYQPNPEVPNILGIPKGERYVLFRFVAWKALHDAGHKGLDFITKKALIELSEKRGYKVFISNESEISDPFFQKYLIKIPPELIHDVLFYADLFVSEGGTMASEAAILGTPAIYVNSLPLMGYLKEEQKAGLISHFSSSFGVIEKMIELLSIADLKENTRIQSKRLICDKIDITDFLAGFVENYPESKKSFISDPDGKLTIADDYKAKIINKVIKTCSRCVLDTTVGDIVFDEKGECKYCKIHDEMELLHPLDNLSEQKIKKLVSGIKRLGRKKQYDCIIGVSGGRDSTYTLYTAVNLGLRPLAVHFDNGWNTEIAVKNIKKACEKLNVPLFTVVADWEEFKDLQIAFLKSSTPDADVPTDYAIYSVLYDIARKEGVRFIFNGHSFRTEGTSPISWTYMDPLYVSDVHKKHGKINRLKSFPHMTLAKLLWVLFISGIREVRLMEYIDYRQKEVDGILSEELDWEYYGGHHHENMYTKFFQSYYLPAKFNIDKRKTELSALIRSGQITKEEALSTIKYKAYEYEPEVVSYALNKLGLSKEEFDEILNAPLKSHNDYRTFLALIRFLKWPIKMATRFKLLPQIFYLKYAQEEL